MEEKKSELKEEQFNIEDFEWMNMGAMGIGLAIGAVIGFFIILVALVKHFLF